MKTMNREKKGIGKRFECLPNYELKIGGGFKMKRFTKSATIVALAVSMLTLSACSSSKSEGGTAASASQTKKNIVTLTVVTSNTPLWSENEGFKAIVKSFEEKNPDIRIKVDGADKMEDVVKVRIATSDFPDLIYYHSGATNMKPLNPEANLVELSDLNINPTLSPGLDEMTKYDGKVYAALLGSLDVGGVIYNKEVFKKYNIEIPKTREEFLAICAKLKAAGVIPMAVGAKDAWSTQLTPFDMMASFTINNKDWINQMNTHKTTLDATPGFIEMLKEMKELQVKGFTNDDLMSTTSDKSQEMLGSGKVAMFEMATWIAPDLKKKFPDGQFGMFALPFSTFKPTVSTFSTGGLMAFKKAKHVEEAKKFIAFATSAEALKIYYDANPQIPVYKGIENKMDSIPTDGKKYVEAGAVALNFKDALIAPIGTWETLLQDIYLGGKTPEQVAKKVQTDLETNAKGAGVAGF
jgi:raffinose/stachyose/melibiose transport system substrate-binding protein